MYFKKNRIKFFSNMILDYIYSRDKKEFSLSYINNDGNKEMMVFKNKKLFKTYYYDPSGDINTWNECKAKVKFTQNPNKFDLKEFILDFEPKYQNLINNKVFPKLYTFDIETEMKKTGEFTSPQVADMPILTISLVNPSLDCIVLGIHDLSKECEDNIKSRFLDYLSNVPFYNDLNLNHTPSFRYIKFESEEKMLRYFLQTIVAKVPILAGWNSIGYDWCYITHRVKNYYPDLSIKLSSITQTVSNKKYVAKTGNEIMLPHPNHTLILDMMEIIEQNDLSVMDAKESMNLDYVARTTLGAKKIEYNGSLTDLFETDYETYVFYNAIDSILVQLIDKRFKTLNQFYLMSQFCSESIGKCFSKIALTEALILKHYHENNIKTVFDQNNVLDRGQLIGAYVKDPIPGKWEWMCCNDFASLYPSTIMTCNISFDNFMGKIGRDFTNEQIEKYKKNPKYFVSDAGCVYKNDKDYTLKIIQSNLKETRNVNKYLAKEMDATVKLDLEHFMNGHAVEFREYSKEIYEHLKTLGFDVKDSSQLNNITNINEFARILSDDIVYLYGLEQAVKLMMNSIYGGSSHISFYWYNMDMANDITGESRWLIHKMEEHIPEYFNSNWLELKELHNELGITVREDKVKEIVGSGKDLVTLVYGDTDSLYSSYSNILETVDGYEKMTARQKLDIILGINLRHLDDHNCRYIENLYKPRHGKSVHKFELETVAKAGVWLNVKKRYGQLLMWKDGKFFDEDNLPVKVKGLEVIKASYPTLARKINKEFLKFLLDYNGKYLTQELNLKNIQYIKDFNESELEDICLNIKVNKYFSHIIDDASAEGIVYALGASYNSKALALYNWLNNIHKFGSEPIYGGKVKCYIVNTKNTVDDTYFAFESTKYPKWADSYAPINRTRMYQKYVLNPFNRILESIGMPLLNVDGSIQMSLF